MSGGAHLSRLRGSAVAVALLLLSYGCTAGAIPVDVPEPPGDRTAAICRALVDDLPNWLGEAARRTVEPASANAAAWGDPGIVLRCGVPRPPALRPASSCTTIEGVDWFAEKAERGYVFTTIGRDAYVEMSVPRDYRPESELLVDVAPAVKANNPVRSPCR